MAADPLTSKTVGDIMNYDMSDDDDPFADIAFSTSRDDKGNLNPRAAKRKADIDDDAFGLGLDEEVKITKTRKPVAKLDEARLLSQLGIPKLRVLVHSGDLAKKLRLKGKGHEFTNVARLLNYYQLWLDDLYPRAKFADGLQLIEKVGHTKRMQSLRREWIDEGKPGYLRDREAKKARSREDDLSDDGEENKPSGREKKKRKELTVALPGNLIFGNGLDDDDEDDMFFADANTKKADDSGDAPEDDDLDALLAEQISRPASKPAKPAAGLDSEGEDDLDALLAEQEFNRPQQKKLPVSTKVTDIFDNNDEHDDDDLDALLAEQEARVIIPTPKESAPLKQGMEAVEEGPAKQELEDATFSSSPIPNDEGDDLDISLAGHGTRESPVYGPESPELAPEIEISTPQAITLQGPDAQMEPDDSALRSSQILDDEIDDDELDTLLAQFPE